LNFSFYIAKRIFKSKDRKHTFSNPIIKIGVTGIALGVAVMIVTLSIITGFQNQIKEKISTFSAHLQVHDYNKSSSDEPFPISLEPQLINELKSNPSVKHIQTFATKNGILKTKTENEGILLKGIDENYDWSYIKPYTSEGENLSITKNEVSKDIFISKTLANKLNIQLNQKLLIYFMTKKKNNDEESITSSYIEYEPRVKDFYVKGIFETGFSDFDKNLAFIDLKQIQKLNYWDSTLVAGYEIYINDFNKLEQAQEELNDLVGFNYKVSSIKEMQAPIFNWLDMINVNAIIIIGLMAIVAAINMISALLILILESTSMIGVLKALGTSNKSVRQIFFHVSINLLAKGLIIGNVVGIGFCLLQQHFKVLKLDAEIYYLKYVPINFSIAHVVLVNAGTVIICLLMMYLPTLILNKITPIKAIRFS
jgi:lipoprotein-releasing system permease protein